MGIEINDKYLYSLQFADDQVLVAQDKDDMKYMARKIYEEYEKWCMKINTDKMKYMCIGGPSSEIELENGERIAACKEYNYLGVTIEEDGKDTKDIKKRIQQERIAIKRPNGIWWSKGIKKHKMENIRHQ